MNTVEAKRNATRLQFAVARIMHYLQQSSLSRSTVSLKDTILTIHFQGDGNEVPSQEQLRYIQNIMFWDSSIDLPCASNLIRYDEPSNTMTINIRSYDTVSSFLEKMKEFGVRITAFDFEHDSFCFYYVIGANYHFTYDELEQLQAVVNPEIKNHDSLRVLGYDGSYSIRVAMNK